MVIEMDLYIDIGSTNIKWAVSDGRKGKMPFPLPFDCVYPHYEVDAEEIFSSVAKLIFSLSPSRVFFSVQMHGYVLLKEGKTVTGYVSWRDERGGVLHPEFSLTEEYGVGMKPNLPRLSLQAQKTDADEFCTLGSYLIYRLTGNNVTHITDAASSGFYNVRTGRADPTVYRLPQISLKLEEAGRIENTAVFTSVGDQQASVLGAVGTDRFDGYILNLGTAGQACCIEDGFVTGEFESRPYFSGTLCTVTGLPGGRYLSESQNRSAEERIQNLTEAYKAAFRKLPKRAGLLVTGGVVRYYREILKSSLERLGRKYHLNEGEDALSGLKILSEKFLR